jgi:predicted NBD/HSP70 family sugar kinase
VTTTNLAAGPPQAGRTRRPTAAARRLMSPALAGQHNRERILQTLYDVGPVSRAELARISQVTKTTIGSIVQPMIDVGVLVEGDPRPSGSGGGKPARPLWFSPTGRPVVAVHLLPGTVRTALVSPTGAVLSESAAKFPATTLDQGLITDCVVACIAEVLPSDPTTVLGIGVAVGGIVDTDAGKIIEVNLAPGLAGLELGALLTERLGLAVNIDLHPRVQAIGDRWFGTGRQMSSFASVYCAEAIGVGLLIDGAIHRPGAGAGGEIGHTVVDLSGELCRCGRRGCWETIATHRWLRREAMAADMPSARVMTAGPLSRLARTGHKGAPELLDRYAQNVAVGLSNLQQVLAPGLFIMHGDIVQGGEPFRAAIEKYVLAGTPAHPGGTPRVTFAPAQDDITLLGAAGLVLSHSLRLLT